MRSVVALERHVLGVFACVDVVAHHGQRRGCARGTQWVILNASCRSHHGSYCTVAWCPAPAPRVAAREPNAPAPLHASSVVPSAPTPRVAAWEPNAPMPLSPAWVPTAPRQRGAPLQAGADPPYPSAPEDSPSRDEALPAGPRRTVVTAMQSIARRPSEMGQKEKRQKGDGGGRGVRAKVGST